MQPRRSCAVVLTAVRVMLVIGIVMPVVMTVVLAAASAVVDVMCAMTMVVRVGMSIVLTVSIVMLAIVNVTRALMTRNIMDLRSRLRLPRPRPCSRIRRAGSVNRVAEFYVSGRRRSGTRKLSNAMTDRTNENPFDGRVRAELLQGGSGVTPLVWPYMRAGVHGVVMVLRGLCVLRVWGRGR